LTLGINRPGPNQFHQLPDGSHEAADQNTPALPSNYQPIVVTVPYSGQASATNTVQPRTHYLETTNGQGPLDPNSVHTATTVPRLQQTPVLSANCPSSGQEARFVLPYPTPQQATVASQHGDPQQPVVVYTLPVKKQQSPDQTMRNQPVTHDRPWTKIANEAIIDGGRVRNTKDSSAQRPRLREPKPDRYKQPNRPPKPEQYRAKPVPKVDDYRDKTRTAARSKRPWSDRKQQAEANPNESRRRKVEKIIVDNPRGNDYGAADSQPDRKKSRKRSATRGRQRELQRRQELLRELIQGFNEADMLQRKLDRTRRWTKDQTRRRGERREREESGRRDSGKRARRPGLRKKQPDRPPKYEDVMSDSGKPAKSSPRKSGNKQKERSKPKAR